MMARMWIRAECDETHTLYKQTLEAFTNRIPERFSKKNKPKYDKSMHNNSYNTDGKKQRLL